MGCCASATQVSQQEELGLAAVLPRAGQLEPIGGISGAQPTLADYEKLAKLRQQVRRASPHYIIDTECVLAPAVSCW